ncbi:MAG: hypothetical protein QM504_15670 [Pseudomonadota bacterium]
MYLNIKLQLKIQDMKFFTSYILLLFTVQLFSYNCYAVTCKKIGIATHCDDGSTYRKVGNTVYGSNGKSYQGIGDKKKGGVVYGSDGKTYRATPETIQGSDGTICTKIGITLKCKKKN